MELSNRLMEIVNMVTPGNVVADIGCDHGYVSIYLVQNKIAPKVIAMDINKGPLERAAFHITQYGLNGYIETRLSDGASALESKEADCMICAGMGGKLMIHILEDALEKVTLMKELILQPQSEIHLVRAYIRSVGFTIVEEKMIVEDGKFYPMMRMVPKNTVNERMDIGRNESEQYLFDYYGPILLQTNNPILVEYLQGKQSMLTKVRDHLRCSDKVTESQTTRLEEIEKELELINVAFSFM